jgi:protein-L-isoaspartate(D-aspartate) O-methyltransferase
MPTCPECGLDVQKAGLCQECKALKDKRKTGTQSNKTKSTSSKGSKLIMKISLSIGFLVVGFFIGWVIFANPLNLLIDKNKVVSDRNSVKEDKSQDAQDQSSISGAASKEGNSKNVQADDKSGFDLAKRMDHVPVSNKNDYISWMTSHTREKEEYLSKRWNCMQTLLTWSKSKSITQDSVLEAFLRAPRENFCREKNIGRVYDFTYLDIGWGQTISGPEIVARMTNALNPKPEHKALEIGTGSGYQSAILSELSNHVYTIEIIEPLAKVTDAIYKGLEADYPEYKNVHRKIADGYFGWEENAPFDRIIVTCGIDHIPPPLLKQLAPEGVMVIPVGPPSGQTILKITKHIDEKGNITLEREDIYRGTGLSGDRFVPFKASDGSSHSAVRDKND